MLLVTILLSLIFSYKMTEDAGVFLFNSMSGAHILLLMVPHPGLEHFIQQPVLSALPV